MEPVPDMFAAVSDSGNIVEIIRQHAAAAPDRPAIVDGHRVLTYAALAALIAQYAGHLHQLGVRPGDRIALVLHDHADHVVLVLAAASLGAASLSINWRAKLDEKRTIADAFAIGLLLHEPDARAPANARAIPLDDSWRRAAAQAPPHAPHGPAHALPLRILLTSGSTGVAKGVELTHAGLRVWCQSVSQALGLKTAQKHLSAFPLAFTGTFNLNLPHLLLGNTIELFPPLFTPQEFVTAIRTRGITSSMIVPTVLRQLLPLARDQHPLLAPLAYLVSLGAPLMPDERRAARQLLTAGFFDGYGASGAGFMAFLTSADIDHKAESVGRAAPLRELEVVDAQDRPLPAGAVGRLRCRGIGVSSQFCNADGGAGESFHGGWYYPGEIARMDGDGYVYLVGRASDLILRGGSNVYPAEIEQVLMRHPNVREAAVIGAPAHNNDEEVVGFVRVSQETAERDLLEICRRNLVAYKVPSSITIVAEFPRTAAGKVRKPELLRLFQASHSAKPT